jgi:hypothetical protein
VLEYAAQERTRPLKRGRSCLWSSTSTAGALLLLWHLTLTLRSGAVVDDAISTTGGEGEDRGTYLRKVFSKCAGTGAMPRKISQVTGITNALWWGGGLYGGPTEEVANIFLLRNKTERGERRSLRGMGATLRVGH